MAFQKRIWKEYVFEKQTLRELKDRHGAGRRTLTASLNQYQAPEKTHEPRKIYLVADATYFGERKERTSWCSICFRDPKRRENLWWGFFDTETTSAYLVGKRYLENLGYQILGLTGDGFSGLRQAFSGIPFQMCQVHMERLVTQGTTKKPLLEAGQALLALVRLLPQKIDSQLFKHYLDKYLDKYRDFLNEKTIHPLTGETSFTHEPLRSATLSLVRFLPYLFTYETDKNLPRTTNTLEGHFSHLKDVVKIHRGLKRPQLERVLHSIFLASTIAPTRKKLKHIL